MSYLKPMLVFLLLSGTVFAQATDAVVGISTADLADRDIDIFIQDGADIFAAPGRWEARDWIAAGAVAGATALAYAFDNDVRAAALPHRPDNRAVWNYTGDWYGRPETSLILGAGLYAGGLFADHTETRVTGRLVLEAFTWSGLITTIMKAAFGRSRPYMNDGKAKLNWLENNNDYLALPSGHSTLAFALTSVLAARIDNIYATIALYGMALLTVSQRIITDNHWLSDTVLGASIGTAVGLTLVHWEDARSGEDDAVAPPPGSAWHAPVFGFSMGL